MKWSLAMIVRNNEDVLGQTLAGVQEFIDEIIIVDTGSTDDTISVAKSYGAKVYEFEWIDDFAAARNYSFSKATGDWIMWLDSGDIIPDESIEAFKKLKRSVTICDPKSDAEMICSVLNRGIDKNGTIQSSFMTVRLLKRSANPIWKGAVHECPYTDNEVAYGAEGCVVNDPIAFGSTATDRNLRILERLIAEGDNSPRTRYYHGVELMSLQRFEEAIEALDRYLELGDFTWQYYDALTQQAKCHNALAQSSKAAEALLQAIYFDPTRAEAFVMLGDAYYAKGEWKRALPFYQAVTGMEIPLDGSFTNTICYSYLPWERIGVCLLQLERKKEAISALHEAIKLADEVVGARLKTLVKVIKNPALAKNYE
jgi:glycosyltransferase involved in cell wall biosynthesis